jgi:hypothetical protein
MDQRIRRWITMGAVALVCLVLVTAPVPAAPRDPLRAAFIALGAHRVTAMHLEGFGATYTPDGARVPLESYRADIDVTRDAMRTPQGFLKAARAAKATLREVPLGTEVSFTSNGRTFIGVINAGNEVDRVMSWVDGPGHGDVLIEMRFRDYEKTPGGVWFPRHLIENRGGHLSLDVWVSSATVNGKQGGNP